jgi:hypothetical protein
LRPDIAWFDPAPAVARQTATVTASLTLTGPDRIFFTDPPADTAILQRELTGFSFSAPAAFP